MTPHLVHAPVRSGELDEWIRNRALSQNGKTDMGFALHVLLSVTFGKSVLQPFRLFRPHGGEQGSLYAICAQEAGELRETAEMVAPPDCAAVFDLERMRSKLLPRKFREGQRLGFDLRARPVRRLDRPTRLKGAPYRLPAGSEADAFDVAEMLEAEENGRRARERRNGWPERRRPEAERREAAYREWLQYRLKDCARVESCRLAHYRWEYSVRRSRRGPEGPDAVLQGTAEVTEPDRFAEMVRRGVGRHRAFGFGLLLLRPADGR